MRDRTGDTSTAAPCFISPESERGDARGRVYPREVPGITAQGKCQREPISRRNPKNEIFGIARAQIIKKHQKTAIKIKKGVLTMAKWEVFRDRETGRELCAYTIRGTFPGERAATVELLAAEHGIPQEQIVMTIETIGGRQDDRV